MGCPRGIAMKCLAKFNIDDFDMLSGGAEPGIMHALPEIVIGHLGTDLHERCCVEPKALSSCES